MNAAKIVRAKLANATGVSALVSDRVWANRLKQNPTLPALTFRVVSTEREHAMGSDPGHVHTRVQVDNYAESFAGAVNLAAQARSALSRFAGTATGITVDEILLDNELDAFEEAMDDGRRVVWRIVQDYIVHHRE